HGVERFGIEAWPRAEAGARRFRRGRDLLRIDGVEIDLDVRALEERRGVDEYAEALLAVPGPADVRDAERTGGGVALAPPRRPLDPVLLHRDARRGKAVRDQAVAEKGGRHEDTRDVVGDRGEDGVAPRREVDVGASRAALGVRDRRAGTAVRREPEETGTDGPPVVHRPDDRHAGGPGRAQDADAEGLEAVGVHDVRTRLGEKAREGVGRHPVVPVLARPRQERAAQVHAPRERGSDRLAADGPERLGGRGAPAEHVDDVAARRELARQALADERRAAAELRRVEGDHLRDPHRGDPTSRAPPSRAPSRTAAARSGGLAAATGDAALPSAADHSAKPRSASRPSSGWPSSSAGDVAPPRARPKERPARGSSAASRSDRSKHLPADAIGPSATSTASQPRSGASLAGRAARASTRPRSSLSSASSRPATGRPYVTVWTSIRTSPSHAIRMRWRSTWPATSGGDSATG